MAKQKKLKRQQEKAKELRRKSSKTARESADKRLTSTERALGDKITSGGLDRRISRADKEEEQALEKQARAERRADRTENILEGEQRTRGGSLMSGLAGGVNKGFGALKDAVNSLSNFEGSAFSNALSKPPRDLSKDDLFPSINQNIAVGKFSGDRIGSGTIFEPKDNIFPIEIVNARAKAMATKTKKDMTLMNEAREAVFATKEETDQLHQREVNNLIVDTISQGKEMFGGNWEAMNNSIWWQKKKAAINSIASEFTSLADARRDILELRANGKDVFFTKGLENALSKIGKGLSIEEVEKDPSLVSKLNQELVAYQGINSLISHHTDKVEDKVKIFLKAPVPKGSSEDYKSSFLRARATGDMDIIYNLYRTSQGGKEHIDLIKRSLKESITGQHYSDEDLELLIESRFKDEVKITKFATQSKIDLASKAATIDIKNRNLEEGIQDDTPLTETQGRRHSFQRALPESGTFQTFMENIGLSEEEVPEQLNIKSISTINFKAQNVALSFPTRIDLFTGEEQSATVTQGGKYDVTSIERFHTWQNPETAKREILFGSGIDPETGLVNDPVNPKLRNGYKAMQYAVVTEAGDDEAFLIPASSVFPAIEASKRKVEGLDNFSPNRGFPSDKTETVNRGSGDIKVRKLTQAELEKFSREAISGGKVGMSVDEFKKLMLEKRNTEIQVVN